MYNHLTNDWGDKEHEIPFDIYHPATRKFVFDTFEQWLKDSPQTDVVRFTTFFYQFTLLFDEKRREKVVDWFGCACTVSPRALDDFEAKYGYRLRPEDFVDGGAYNSAWRVPRKAQRDWIDFLSGFVRENVKQLADMSHAAGKEAMMFLGDQWKASTTGARPAARSCARRSAAWATAATSPWPPSSRSSWTR